MLYALCDPDDASRGRRRRRWRMHTQTRTQTHSTSARTHASSREASLLAFPEEETKLSLSPSHVSVMCLSVAVFCCWLVCIIRECTLSGACICVVTNHKLAPPRVREMQLTPAPYAPHIRQRAQRVHKQHTRRRTQKTINSRRLFEARETVTTRRVVRKRMHRRDAAECGICIYKHIRENCVHTYTPMHMYHEKPTMPRTRMLSDSFGDLGICEKYMTKMDICDMAVLFIPNRSINRLLP